MQVVADHDKTIHIAFRLMKQKYKSSVKLIILNEVYSEKIFYATQQNT